MSERLSASPSGRIPWLDGWRGVAVYLMLVYHLSYDLADFGWMSWSTLDTWPMSAMQLFISRSFILCSGISCCLSRSNLKRGLWCALQALPWWQAPFWQARRFASVCCSF